MNTREAISIVKTSLELLERQGNGYENVVQELEAEAEHGLTVIQNIIDGMAKQRRLWLTNDMDAKIERGEVNGKYTVERLREIKALFDNFAAWVETPLVVMHADGEVGMPEIAIPPIVIVSRRENPPANWGVEIKAPDFESEAESGL